MCLNCEAGDGQNDRDMVGCATVRQRLLFAQLSPKRTLR